VVVAAGDEQQRRAVVVVVVDPVVVLARVDVGQRAAPEDLAGGGDVVALVQRARLLLAEAVGERVVPLLEREADGLVRLAGFLSTGNVACTCDSGTRLTPSVGAELIATPAAP
jgi:hypothetical protein